MSLNKIDLETLKIQPELVYSVQNPQLLIAYLQYLNSEQALDLVPSGLQ